MATTFSPPSMLRMPFARETDRRAAQEDAYIRWCEERDNALHTRPDDERIAMDAAAFAGSFTESGTPAGDARAALPEPMARASTFRKVA